MPVWCVHWHTVQVVIHVRILYNILYNIVIQYIQVNLTSGNFEVLLYINELIVNECSLSEIEDNGACI